MWAEFVQDKISSKRSRLMINSAPSQDRIGHHSNVNFVGTCRGKLITLSQLTRHLRDVHFLVEAEVNVSQNKPEGSNDDVAPPVFIKKPLMVKIENL
jgi:hypothetical protein